MPKHVAGKLAKGKGRNKRGFVNVKEIGIEWKKRGASSRPRPPRSIKSGNLGGSALMMNAPQTTMTNPNRFWEVCKASTPGGLCIRAREPVGTVNGNVTGGGFINLNIGGGAFDLTPFNGNFPRLSSLAAAFEFYYFKRVRMDFISNQSTSYVGQLLFWVDYEVADTTAASTQEALSNISSVISNVYSNQSLVMDGKLSRLTRYVTNTTSDVNPNQTIQAVINAGVSGYTATTGTLTFGEVMLEYEIEFFTPSQVSGAYLSKEKVLQIDECLKELKDLSDNVEVTRRCDAIAHSLSRKHHRREPKVKIIKSLLDDPDLFREEIIQMPTVTEVIMVDDTPHIPRRKSEEFGRSQPPSQKAVKFV